MREAEQDSRKRQLAWLQKSGFVSRRKQAWRPQKRLRVSSCKMLQGIDHQLQVAGHPGLSAFQRQVPDGLPWNERPLLHLALDQESSNMTANHWLYSEKVNCEVTWDPAHRA